MKWVHMERYELILRLDGAMWGKKIRGYETGLGFHTYETGMKPV